MSLNEFPPTGPEKPILPQDEPYTVPTPANAEKPASGSGDGAKKGCLFGMGCFSCGALGCLGIIILMVLLGVGGWNWVINNIFSETPLEFTAVEMTAQEEQALKNKITDFQKELETNSDGIAILKLTPKEVNYEMQKSANKQDVYLNVEIVDEDKLSAKMSVPLENASASAKGGKKYFINLSFRGKMKIEDYDIKADLDNMKIGKLDISDKKQLEGASESFQKELQSNENYRKLPAKIKSFEVKDGMLIFEIKKKAGEGTVSEPTGTETDKVDDSSTSTPDADATE